MLRDNEKDVTQRDHNSFEQKKNYSDFTIFDKRKITKKKRFEGFPQMLS
jgi:hypothetical protein